MSTGADTPAVQVDDVDMVFNEGSGGEVAALSGINLTIRAGEFVTLIGPSGCGRVSSEWLPQGSGLHNLL